MAKTLFFLIATVLANLAVLHVTIAAIDENSARGIDMHSNIAGGVDSVCKEGDLRCYIDLVDEYFQKADFNAMLKPTTNIIEYITAMRVKMAIPSHKIGHAYRLRAKIYVELQRYQEAVDDANAALGLNAEDEHAAKVRDKAQRLMLGKSEMNEHKSSQSNMEL